MDIKRKAISVVMIAAMVLGLAAPVLAATSPTEPGTTTNPGYDTSTYTDYNTQDHVDKTVTTEFSTGKSITTKVEAKKASASKVTFGVARNKKNKAVNVVKIGDGTNGVFDSKGGRYVTTAVVSSSAKQVTLRSNAFKGSKVNKLWLKSKKVAIQKSAFKGTKTTNPTIVIGGSRKSANAITVSKGAFAGLGKNAKIVVCKKTMRLSEYRKLKAKLKAAGFKGTICWK